MAEEQQSNPVPQTLQEDLKFYKDPIKEVSRETIERKISDFPIFIAHQHELNLGEKILDKDELGRNWHIHASVLEELVEKGVILEEKKDEFKQTFKDPTSYVCIFLVHEDGGNFIFLPKDGELIGEEEGQGGEESVAQGGD